MDRFPVYLQWTFKKETILTTILNGLMSWYRDKIGCMQSRLANTFQVDSETNLSGLFKCYE